MTSNLQDNRRSASALLVTALAVLCSSAAFSEAQDQPLASAPTTQRVAPQDHTFPRWEVFGGYSFLYPGANLQYINPGATLPVSVRQESNPRGLGGSVTYNFRRWLGLTGDFSGDWKDGEGGPNLSAGYMGTIDDSNLYSASIGPKLTYRKTHFAPFVEGLVGWQRLHSDYIGSNDAVGVMGGGGIDIPLSKHIALRPIQGDYVFSNQHFGPTATVSATQVRGVRLQSGAVFLFGGTPPPAPVGYSCSANPSEIFPGDHIAVNGSAVNLNPKKTVTYSWTSSGGKVSGTSSTSDIDTSGLAPGTYTVTGHVAEGVKAGQSADCTSSFTVRPFGPPTISCSANPAAVDAGGSSAITAQAASPQNRRLSYSYSTTSGQVSGSSESASLNTAGVPPGEVTVTCNVADDTGQTASASTIVTINTPAPAPAPKTQALCSIDFGRDKRRPARVNNEAKACLDDVALNLQRSSDATYVAVGNSAPGEKHGTEMAAERAMNTRTYLVNEKGIDPSRVQVRTGTSDTPSVQNYLIPSGATFANDVSGTAPVNVSAVRDFKETDAHLSGSSRHGSKQHRRAN